MITRKGRK